jgi:hypothetical protein
VLFAPCTSKDWMKISNEAKQQQQQQQQQQ